MLRPTLADLLQSRLPSLIGLCADDVSGVAAAVNAATQRLLFARELSDNGPWGTWIEIAFNTSQSNPFIVTPRNVARLGEINVCTFPVPVRNQFYEYLRFGSGRVPKDLCKRSSCPSIEALERNTVATFTELVAGNKVRIYPGGSADEGRRVLVQGLDTNDQQVFSLDGLYNVAGEFVTLAAPFVDTLNTWNRIDGLQKDITLQPVTFQQVDPLTSTQTALSIMEPGETTASYRRYYLHNLPRNCCDSSSQSSTTVQVTALARLAYVPVVAPTDYLVIPNVEAIIEEAQAVRLLGTDDPGAKAAALAHHREAIRFLNGQLAAMEGTQLPSIQFAPFGSAHLSRVLSGFN